MTFQTQAQIQEFLRNQRTGRCYTKCHVPDLYGDEEIALPVYTGENKLYRDGNLELVTLNVDIYYEFQEQKKSSGPKTWCRVQMRETEDVLIVKDTFLKLALSEFKDDHYLPFNTLDKETLSLLGIEIDEY